MNHSLSSEKILTYLNKPKNIVCAECIASTNTALKNMAEEGALQGTLLCTTHQTAGKGRLGKSFFSPPGCGVYFSLLLRPALPLCDGVLITVAAAVAVRRAILSLLSYETQVKWVNDIYGAGKKLCGILTEGATEANGSFRYAVLGIGINLATPKTGYPPEFAYKTTSLEETCGTLPEDFASKLIAAVVNQFDLLYPALNKQDFLPEYKAASCLTGRKIEILSGPYQGLATANDIDDNANLCVTLPDGQNIALSSGDVSIRF